MQVSVDKVVKSGAPHMLDYNSHHPPLMAMFAGAEGKWSLAASGGHQVAELDRPMV